MGKETFYAVAKGISPGIYGTWTECEKNVKGYKGAIFKKFSSREEAEAFLFSYSSDQTENNVPHKVEKSENDVLDSKISELLEKKVVVAFTDGGYDNKTGTLGYGVYILTPDSAKPIEISDIVRTGRFSQSNNVTAEVMGVTTALDWVISNEFEKVTIFHDYEGIGKWANGSWRAKSDIAKWYLKQLNEIYNEYLDISYEWVRGHSGISYNEEADRLATEAIQKNLKPRFKMSETFFSCNSVIEKDFKSIMSEITKAPEIDIDLTENKSKGTLVYKLKYNNEKLTITYSRKTVNTLVQGKANSLFALFLSFYTEKIPDFDLVQAYGKMHLSTIKLSEIDESVKLMNLPNDFPQDAIKLIKQALSEKTALNSGRKNEEFDYSHYIFPAFRALEGCIKYYFEISGKHISETGTIGGFFNREDGNWIVTETNAKKSIYKDKLEKMYKIYNRTRNSLGHFGELLSNEDNDSTTAMIDTSEEAVEIIDEILDEIKSS